MDTLHHLDEIIGQPVADFRLVAGGSLILYVGPKQPDAQMTKWTLHIDSAWRLDHGDEPLLGSLDSCVETKDEAEPFLEILRRLQNRAIESVCIGQDVKDITLALSDRYRLATFSHSLVGDGWQLRCCDGRRVGMAEKDITQISQWTVVQDRGKA